MKDLSWFNLLSPAEQQALLEGPSMKPPPGVIPNLVNPPNKNDLGYGVATASALLCGLLVVLRLYARAFYHKKMVIEDSIAVAALGVLAGYLYCVWKVIDHPGIFIHLWHVRMKDLPHVLYYMSTGATVYGNVIMLLKTGILLEWARIFVPQGFKNAFWWTCHSVIVVNVMFYVICTFVEIFGCNPRRKLWEPTLPGTCMDMAKVNIVSASINFASDVIILFLPQKVIWGLHMSLKKKFGVGTLFAVGVFACVCAGFRIHSASNFSRSDDILYSASDMGLWCLAEMVAGFFVFCLPATPKLLADSPWMRKILSTFKTFSKQTSEKQSSSSGPVPIPFRRTLKPSADPESLFTDSDKSDFLPLSNVSVTSEFTLQEHIETKDVADKNNTRAQYQYTLP